MNPVIDEHRRSLTEQCQRFGVRRLEVFGSAARDDFDRAKSDFDFIVSFADRIPGTYADRYLDFADALERLLGRKVDLLTERCIRNPWFRASSRPARVAIIMIAEPAVIAATRKAGVGVRFGVRRLATA